MCLVIPARDVPIAAHMANEVWTGTTQIRDVKKEGDQLIYTTRPAPITGDGKMSFGTLVWEKVK